jgi:transcriptional antiterminator NusG
MTDTIYHLIKNLKKVSGFLGPQGKPSPISEEEVSKILGNMEESVSNPTNSVIFSIGEQVKVSDGPFASFNGLIEEIDEEKSRLKVSVSIFGRPTPVDLDYTQVEKL